MNGHYRDYFFPDNGVRYIAVNDNYDGNQEDNDIAPFKDILNERFTLEKVRKTKPICGLGGAYTKPDIYENEFISGCWIIRRLFFSEYAYP